MYEYAATMSQEKRDLYLAMRSTDRTTKEAAVATVVRSAEKAITVGKFIRRDSVEPFEHQGRTLWFDTHHTSGPSEVVSLRTAVPLNQVCPTRVNQIALVDLERDWDTVIHGICNIPVVALLEEGKKENKMYHISAWQIHTGNLRHIVAKATEAGKVTTDDIVWRGPSGDAVVTAIAADLDEEYGDYVDAGLVEEYLD